MLLVKWTRIRDKDKGNPKILVEFRLKLLLVCQFNETIIKCVWLRIARMEIDIVPLNWRAFFSQSYRSVRLVRFCS